MLRNVFLFSLLFISISLFSQFKISGVITDGKGLQLAGANVILKDLNRGTTSDLKGKFVLKDVPEGSHILEVSYLGYSPASDILKVNKDLSINFSLSNAIISGEEIIVRSTRAGLSTPTTYSEVNKDVLKKKNLGQDMPFLLGMEPSLVTTSDAGAGIGYTGLWVRGSNIQRINVTVNGVPINDPESHGVFWVNMPDFASSVESAQIQRGVGTSTNGGGAFGATINLETNLLEKEAFGEINSSMGSFRTFKNNARFGTGLIKEKWAFEGRLSKITSDGYIDRAESDLSSFFLQGGYYTDKTTIKAIVFGGKEKTYQAWYGADEWTMENIGRTYNWAGAISNNDGSTRFYDNQTDNYQQDHYQLHLSQKINKHWNFNSAIHYTYGRGYYEEYKQGEDLSNYPIGYQYFGYDSTTNGGAINYFYHDTVKTSDLIVRRWLDNHFYGATYAFNYKVDNLDLSIGGAYNKYANAKHYGEIVWAQLTGDANVNQKYYDNVSNKTDFNTYAKANYKLAQRVSVFADVQIRSIRYTAEGDDNDGSTIRINENYNFFNPKAGMTYSLPKLGMVYGSLAVAHREPIRSDFTDAPEGVKPESEELWDYELGIRNYIGRKFYTINGYYMQYKNQLVLTGQINDVGSPIRANVGESSRFGIELDGGMQVTNWFKFRANIALGTSSTDFKRVEDSLIVSYNSVQVSFSPQIVAGLELSFIPVKNVELSATTRYVSRQFLDLTETKAKSLDPYVITNLQASYAITPEFIEEIRFSLIVNNILNAHYSTNGYTWGETPYYYPQAGINFLAGISLRF